MTEYLTKFSGTKGEDIKLWIRLFRLTAATLALTKEHSKLLLQCSLSGEAETWYNLYRMEASPTENIFQALKERFDNSGNMP